MDEHPLPTWDEAVDAIERQAIRAYRRLHARTDIRDRAVELATLNAYVDCLHLMTTQPRQAIVDRLQRWAHVGGKP